MLYCLKCGNRVTSDTDFCSKCGNPLASGKKYGVYLAIFIAVFIFGMLGLLYLSDSSPSVSLSEQAQAIAKKKVVEAKAAITAVNNYQVAYDSALSQYDNILAQLQNGKIKSDEASVELDTLAAASYGKLTSPTNVLINMDRYNKDGSSLADSASSLKSVFEQAGEDIRTDDQAGLKTLNAEINYAKNTALSTAADISNKAKEDGYVAPNNK